MTLDAMGCQRKIAQEIIKKKADYLLAVKGNQGKLADAFDNWYSPAMWTGEKYESYSIQEKGHGRQETLLSIVSHDLTPLGDLAYDWPELKSIDIVPRYGRRMAKPLTRRTLCCGITSVLQNCQRKHCWNPPGPIDR